MSPKTQLKERLDSTPLAPTVLTDSTLHERFPEGTVLTLIEMLDFSNVGDAEPLYIDNKIGFFKLTESSISWSVIKVITNHYTNEEDGTQWLYFKVVNKMDNITDVKNFVIGKDALLEMKELI